MAKGKERTLGESIEDRDRRYPRNDPERPADSDLRSTQRRTLQFAGALNSRSLFSFRSACRILSRYQPSLNHRIIVSRTSVAFYSTRERKERRITRLVRVENQRTGEYEKDRPVVLSGWGAFRSARQRTASEVRKRRAYESLVQRVSNAAVASFVTKRGGL